MSDSNKVVAFSTTIAMTISVLAVLIGAGIGWGMLQSKISFLEARANTINEKVIKCEDAKLDKEQYQNDVQIIRTDIKEISKDIKTLLQRSMRR